MKIRELIEKLNKATKAYDEGNPIITDKEWDDLYFKLEELEKKTGIIYPDSPTQKVIFYEPVTELKKVEHNHPMLSLAKTKDWDEFLKYFNPGHDVIGMIKLDGLTCSLRYLNGKLISAETRGNGVIGEDILHNIPYVKGVPLTIPYKEELIVDGEVICTYKDFEKWNDKYVNPRNFASGSIRLLTPEDRDLTFVVWNIVKGFDGNSFMNKLLSAEENGFIVTPWTSSFDWDAREFLVNKAKELSYPIDGLVGRYDDISYGESLGATDHHSRAAYAFKFYDDTYTTHLIDIDWGLGRTGVLTPVAIFEPIEIDGTMVERASLHNLTIMNKVLGMPYEGQEIEVCKMNMIIPQVVSGKPGDKLTSTFLPIPAMCPVCGSPTEIRRDNDTQELYCINPKCGGVLINKLDHFAGKTGLDIKGISTNVIEDLVSFGYLTKPVDFFYLQFEAKDWAKQPGYGPASVKKILNSIEDAQPVLLDKFICAIGIPLIGPVQAKVLADYFKSWEGFINAVDSDFDFEKIEGMGAVSTKSIRDFSYIWADEVAAVIEIIYIEKPTSNQTLTGKTICITGSLNNYENREDLEKVIVAHGGKTSNSISKRTSYLINNDLDSTSSKCKKAKSLGVPIMSEEDFIKNFLTFEEKNE